MKKSLEWRRLDITTREHVHSRIRDAGLSLSRGLLADLEALACEVWVAVPRAASREAAHDLSDGISGTTPIVDPMDEPVMDWIHTALTSGPGRYLIVEHSIWAPTHEYVKGRSNIVMLGSELYTITRGREATLEAIVDELGEVNYQEVAVLVGGLRDEALFAGVGTLRSDVGRQMRGHVLAIVVEAYDAEGFVVLCCEGTCPRPSD